MTEKLISTRKGVYGVVNVTLPIQVKTLILERGKKLGYKRAEFLRLALLTGFASISDTINILKSAEGQGDTARTGREEARKP